MFSNTGYWILDEPGMQREHVFDEKVCSNLDYFFQRHLLDKKFRIADFGCGRCDYTNRLLDLGYNVIGIDGNPATSKYCSRPEKIVIKDLTEKLGTDPFDFIVCLEVGEHIPKQYESSLIHNIDSHLKPNGYLVLSWAVEGQDGYGHVNCQSNFYIKSKFSELGYKSLDFWERQFRRQAKLWWFRNTIMVFQKIAPIS